MIIEMEPCNKESFDKCSNHVITILDLLASNILSIDYNVKIANNLRP